MALFRASRTDDRARAGRDFAEFYTAELAGQVRGATLILGSHAAAQDAVHDAFVEVFRNWANIAEPGPYLQRAVVNRCRDLIRRNRVAQKNQHFTRPNDIPDPDIHLYDALAKLSFNHRAAVVLRYYLQLTEAEIAERLDCPTGSVGPWIRRGLDHLSIELRLPEEDR